MPYLALPPEIQPSTPVADMRRRMDFVVRA